VDSVMDGTIDEEAMRRVGFKWDESVPARGLTSVGGCIAAARSALEDGLSGQLAGGSHHAHRDFGSGFCVFNDQAVAALTLLEEKRVDRIAIVDLDVHQGDGTASICQSVPDIFVLSVHGEKNFPFRKYPADLDVGLPDATEDADYLRAVEKALDHVWEFEPDIILYQAGVDPLEEDRLGRLSLTLDGLMSRDRLVLQSAKDRDIPVSMSIGGGYTDPIDTSVIAYANTYRVAREIWNWA
ncbi:MAG: histone deacetylase family protein, partial [Methyloligellaceae bacterium]